MIEEPITNPLETPNIPLPSEKSVAQSLLDRVFNIKGGKIRYKPSFSARVGLWAESMHSPLSQLYSIYKRGLMPVFPPTRFTDSYYNTPYPNIYTRKVAEVEMVGRPGEMIELIESDPVAAQTGIKELLFKKIRNANDILLAGCVDMPSGYNLIELLHRHGFKGTLDIIDLSAAPMALIDAANGVFDWQGRYEITVKTSVGDLRMLEKYDKKYQIIIADVLGHYLTTPEIIDHFTAVPLHTLTEGGMLLIRDMEEGESISPELRQVSGNTSLRVTEEDIAFQQWLSKYFKYVAKPEELVAVRTGIWPDPIHEPRMGTLRNVWSYAIEPFLRLRYVLNTTPKDTKLNRLFQIFVFTQDKNLQETEQVFDPSFIDGSQHAVYIQHDLKSDH